MKNILSPSILSADFAKMGDELAAIAKGGAQYVHLDVMDGHFVPNISFGAFVVAALKKDAARNGINLAFDVHLMICDPKTYVKPFVDAGADLIVFHYEACAHDEERTEIIDLIRSYGVKAGLAISPDTPVDALIKFCTQIDMALIMSVYPGFGGQSFIPAALDKARALRSAAPMLDIQMDGGIALSNLQDVLDSGVNVVVVGSAIFSKPDIVSTTEKYMEVLA
ncbi:MAG: ribulose-phosphate 3-epimerase [Defluviitaleaceae bacterium]|nr:ribulose-phosphate 3-epimerase [Defluviitaleaceae bacterium]